MNIERMQQLIRVLEQVSSNQQLRQGFNLAAWLHAKDATHEQLKAYQESGVLDDEDDGWFHHAKLNETKLQSHLTEPQCDTMLVPHNCGATACAAGYAGLDPWFREHGFKTTASGDIVLERGVDNHIDNAWPAIEEFFDLTEDQSLYLFLPSYYPEGTSTSIDVVLARVKEFTADPSTMNLIEND